MDHRRHRVSQKGAAFGWGDPTILRSARQAGQLSSRGFAVAGQSPRQLAGSLPAVSAGGVGAGPGTAGEGQGARNDRVSDPTRDRPLTDQIGLCRRSAAGRGADGCRLRQRHRATDTAHDAGPELCRRDRRQHRGVAAGNGALAGAARVRPRTAAQAAAARWRAPPGQRQDARPRVAGRGLAQYRLARGKRGLAGLALRPRAGTPGASRHLASRTARRGMAADRMAARRARTDQILAFYDGRGHPLRPPRRFGEIALADRARLPGTQAGTRLWRLRRARVARLPPPCHALYRRLWLPDRRTRRPSPLRTVWRPALVGIYPSLRLPTQRRRRSGPNGTCQTRLPPCAAVSSSPSPRRYRDALAATRRSAKSAKFPITDAVGLSV